MRPPEFGPENELTDLERRLTQWQPASGLNRDRLMYEAGRAVGWREGGRPVALLAAAVVLVAAGLGTLVVHQRGERQALESRIAALSIPLSKPAAPVIREEPKTEIVARPPAPNSYLALTHAYLNDLPIEPPVRSSHEGMIETEAPLRVHGVFTF